MLGIRTALKPDLECSATELVYSTTLRFPSDVLGYSQSSADLDASDHMQRLRQAMTLLRSTPPSAPTDDVALVVHSALKPLDMGCRKYACAFLDSSSAFNTVPHPLFLTKTSAFGSAGWVISWLSDYFTFRTQFVQSGKRKSSTLSNDCGVLQGSILSPHLFSLHNDDLRSPNDCLLVKYADVVVVGHPLKSQTHLRSLKDGLNHVLAWSEENGLLINNQKSVQCIFRLRPSSNPDSSDILPNEVSSFRYLGVTLSSNLSFSLHIESIFIKVRKLRYYIRRWRSYHTPQPLVWRFIDACILPLIL
ncbi:hypothetical protein SprV_0501969100 [Sparganum proliferum]